MKKVMSDQFSDHFSSVAKRYAEFRPRYPAGLFEFLAATASKRELAWDCGCGNGQASVDLAGQFQRVIATDASADQIAAAQKHPKVEYRVAPAENSGLEPESVDLVTVAQALHWFDLPKFYAEADRVLRPGGVLAVWCYGVCRVKGDEVDALAQDFYARRIGPYWPPERKHVEAGYRTLPFPFAEIEPPAFQIVKEWSMDELVGYYSSWSGTKRYAQANGDPLPQIRADFAKVWGRPEQPREVSWPVALRLGRKPAAK